MPRKAEYVNVHCLYIDREYSCRLGRIYNIEKPVVVSHLSDSSDVQHISGQIRAVSRHDGLCLGPDCLFDILITDSAFLISFHKRHICPCILQIIQRTKH